MDVLNMNTHQVSVRCDTAAGGTDYVTIAARRRAKLPSSLRVNTDWLAGTEKVSVFEDGSNTAITLTPVVIPLQITPPPVASLAPADTQ